MQICYIKPARVNKEINYISRREVLLLLKCECMLFSCLHTINTYAFSINKKLDEAEVRVNCVGDLIVHIMQIFLYWCTMFLAILDIIKSCKKQDISGTVSIVIKYATMLLAGYCMPKIWDLIKDLFGDNFSILEEIPVEIPENLQ